MEAQTVPRRPPDPPPNARTIFLSHSGKEKAFVDQLNTDLERVKLHAFFDQNYDCLPIGEKFARRIFEATKQCRVAVVVLSPGYLQSKWPMLELIKFHESIKKPNNSLKFVPLFFKVKPDDLREASHGDPKQWEEWKRGWSDMKDVRQGKVVFDEKLCEDAIKELRKFNGMVYTGGSEVAYRKAVVDEIYKQSCSAFPFDTSDIRGCDRMCKVVSGMFVEKEEQTKFLGLYGDKGSGKTTICCEAMCNYFQDEFQGRISRVELEFDTNSKSAVKNRKKRLRQVFQDLFHTDQMLQDKLNERQLKKLLKEKLLSHRVFLVVDNVSQSSREEADFYVKAKFARGSKVLVTSRNQKILESILEDKKFCHPIPGLERKEASQLILSKAARSKLTSQLDTHEEEILEHCVDKICAGEHYSPFRLRALAMTLQATAENEIDKWVPIVESLHMKDNISIQLLQYEKLDKASKLVFLDLAFFTNTMALTHEDFDSEMELYGEHRSFHEVVTCIALLHGVTFRQAAKMVRELVGKPFIDWRGDPSRPEVRVPPSYMTFAHWLITEDGNGEAKDWCMVRLPEGEVSSDDEDFEDADDEDEDFKDSDEHLKDSDDEDEKYKEFADLTNGGDVSKLVRVSISRLSLASKDHVKIQQWRYVACLELIQVSYLQSLDLQGLHSLRVLMVEECEDLERIVCTCESSLMPTDGPPHSCYDHQNDAWRSGCMPNLRYVQLQYLEQLKRASFTVHCWSLETLWFYTCANLEMLPDLRYCRKLKKLRLPCGDFQGFHGLSGNRALTELAFEWDPETVRNFTEEMRVRLLREMMSLENLRVLDIVDETQVYEWIPAGFQILNVTKLVHLTILDLSYATTIEEVEGLEVLSELESLGLYGCCNLRMLPDLTEFHHLKLLCIGHCHNLDWDEDEDEDKLPCNVKAFHKSGESCSFGIHKCLDPYILVGSCKKCISENVPESPTLQQAPQVQASQEQVGVGVNSGGEVPIEGAFGQLVVQDEEGSDEGSSGDGSDDEGQRRYPGVEENCGGYPNTQGNNRGDIDARESSEGHGAMDGNYGGHETMGGNFGGHGPMDGNYAGHGAMGGNFGGHGAVDGNFGGHGPMDGNYAGHGAMGGNFGGHGAVDGNFGGHGPMDGNYAGHGAMGGNFGGHGPMDGNYARHGAMGGNFGGHGAVDGNFGGHGAVDGNFGGHGPMDGNYAGHGAMGGNFGGHGPMDSNYAGHGAMGGNFGEHGAVDGNFGGHGAMGGNYGGHGPMDGNYAGHDAMGGNFGEHGAVDGHYGGHGPVGDNYGGHGSLGNNYQW